MLQFNKNKFYKNIPKCINCMYYNPNGTHLSRCRRIFVRELPVVETCYQPSTITARSYDHLCGFEGKYFVDKYKFRGSP